MRCRKAQLLVSLRIDGRLDATRSRALEGHLAECAACRTAALALETGWDALALTPPPPAAPEDFHAIASRLERRPGLRAWLDALGSFAPGRAATAATAAVLALVGAAGGLWAATALERAAPAHPGIEAIAVAEAFGDMPMNLPAAALLGPGALR